MQTTLTVIGFREIMKTIICIASGPSLTFDDCTKAYHSGMPIIAVNSSWSAVQECDHIFAADYLWWTNYHDTITSRAKRWTQSERAKSQYGVNLFRPADSGPFNSGQRAVQLAAYLGANRVILLGYDCCMEKGAHWHGMHPPAMHNPDPGEVARWHTDFSTLVSKLPHVEIINASRHTALTVFPRTTIEAAINA